MTKFAVYAEQHGKMVLAENGFSTHAAAAQWAAIEFGLGNWEVREYSPEPDARATAIAAEERRTAAWLELNPAADPACKFCHGTGIVKDWVDYGSTVVSMDSVCECVEDVDDADAANWEPVIDYEPRRVGW